jgi:hypothetical protein
VDANHHHSEEQPGDTTSSHGRWRLSAISEPGGGLGRRCVEATYTYTQTFVETKVRVEHDLKKRAHPFLDFGF